MVSEDSKNSKRNINNVESSVVVVPRTATSFKAQHGSRSKTQVNLQSSSEKGNTSNDLKDLTLTPSHDVIKCPLSSLQKALKSSVNGGKILHSLRCTETREQTKSVVENNLEISAEKKFVTNDGSVKIIKIVSPKKCNIDAASSQLAETPSSENYLTNKLTYQAKVSPNGDKLNSRVCHQQNLGYHQLKSTEELLSSPEDGEGYLQTRKQSFEACEQNSETCEQKHFATSNFKESPSGCLVATSVGSTSPPKTLTPPRNSRQSVQTLTTPKSAIQSTSRHCDHSYSPVSRITSPPKVNILKRSCSVNKRSALVDFSETVKRGNLTPPKKVQRCIKDEGVTVRKELFVQTPGHSLIFSGGSPSRKLRKTQNSKSKPDVSSPPSTIKSLSNCFAMSPLLQYPLAGAKISPLRNPESSTNRLSWNETMDGETEFLLARQDYPTLDSIFMHFQRCKEMNQSQKHKTPLRSKDTGLSLADANQLMAQKRMALNPSLESCMGIGVTKEPHYYDKSKHNSPFGSPRSAFSRKSLRLSGQSDRESCLSGCDVSSMRSFDNQTLVSTATQLNSEEQNSNKAITLQVIAPTTSVPSIICNPSDLETIRQSGHQNWVATILPSTPTPGGREQVPESHMPPENTNVSQNNREIVNDTLDIRENSSEQELQRGVDPRTPDDSILSSTMTPAAHKLRQTALATPLQKVDAATPLQQLSSSRPTAPVLSLSEPREGVQGKEARAMTSSKDSSWQLTPQPVKRINKGMRKVATDSKQLILDFGQKDFGTKSCSGCGFVYTPSHPNDFALHEKYHNKFFRLLKYNLRGTEVVLCSWGDGVAVKVNVDDGSLLDRKVKELRSRVDSDLGFVDDLKNEEPLDPFTCVFISTEGYLTGYLLAEKIQSVLWSLVEMKNENNKMFPSLKNRHQAYRVISDGTGEIDDDGTPSVQSKTPVCRQKKMQRNDLDQKDKNDSVSSSWSCSLTPEAAMCGVSRIWVAPKAQRKGIASRLVDTLRLTFSADRTIPKELVAFSDPTNSGRMFAMSYVRRKDFLVFKCFQSDLPVRDFLKEQEDRDRELLYGN